MFSLNASGISQDMRATLSPSFWHAPAKGRRILAGFSYLQRIKKGSTTRFWFNEPLKNTKIEWAAVRTFELLQEADNLAIDDMDVTNWRRTFEAMRTMRAGGYSIAMILLGDYEAETDHLEIVDKKLQDEITRLIHFLYLDKESEAANFTFSKALKNNQWSCADALPHIMQAFAERRLFKNITQSIEEDAFFKILDALPRKHILHDTAIGLALPDAEKNKNWVYISDEECRPCAFFSTLGEAISGQPIIHHMRGYGDRLRPQDMTRFKDNLAALESRPN